MIQWNDLPKEIQEKMLERQEEQTGKRDAGVFKNYIFAGMAIGGFRWGISIEGHDFWESIVYGNFDSFYVRYPTSQTENIASLQRENKILRRKLEQIKEILQ